MSISDATYEEILAARDTSVTLSKRLQYLVQGEPEQAWPPSAVDALAQATKVAIQALFGSAPACTITLTGDVAAMFDAREPLDISGQTVSKTVAASVLINDYAAGGPVVHLGTDWRAIGYQASTFTETDGVSVDTSHALYIFSSDLSEAVICSYSGDRGPGMPNSWAISTAGGEELLALETDPFAKVAIAIDGGTGDVAVSIGGTLYTKSTLAILSGVFTMPSVFPAAFFTHQGDPTTYEATVTTDATGLADFGLPAGTLDWCDNPLN